MLIKIVIAAILGMAAVWTQAAPAEKIKSGAELIFASAIEVSPRANLTLYDIVETRGASDQLIETLKSRRLSYQDNQVTRSDLVHALRGLNAKFLLPQEIKLIRSKQNVSRMELERKIKNQLLARCSDCDYQIQVQNVPRVLSPDWSIELNIDLAKETVLIPITDEKLRGASQWVVAEIKKYANIPVAARNIATQSSIEPSMFRMEKRIVRTTTDLVMSAEELDGVISMRAVGSGQTFSKRDLKKEQIIKKNQVVKAQVEKNGFQIFVTAVAEDSGAIGDLIRVKNLDSQKIIAAEVVGRGIVKID